MSTNPPPPITSETDYNFDRFFDQPIEVEASEQELRELYDNYEIERYLAHFSAYVTEVRATEPPSHAQSKLDPYTSSDNPTHSPTTSDKDATIASLRRPSPQNSGKSLVEEAVSYWLVPLLPPTRPSSHAFTIGRLRLTMQRLYLAVEPVYIPFFRRMWELASWNDRKISFIYCSIFWILWYHNLLLPSFMLRVFYSLLRRKILPYPTLAELKEHKREISRAAEFGNQISDRLSASSSFELKEMWRLFKIVNRGTKDKLKASTVTDKTTKAQDDCGPIQDDDATILDDPKNNQLISDSKRLGLDTLDEMADLHERVKNIFIWRRPASSRLYGILLLFLFFATLLIPARYLSKAAYLLVGFFFWHIPPVIAALQPEERLRLPPAFGDVPTDADYAIELIAHRVAAGLDVSPPKRQSTVNQSASNFDHDAGNHEDQSGKFSQPVDWKKWAGRATIAKSWVDDGRRLIVGEKALDSHKLTPTDSRGLNQVTINSNHNPVSTSALRPGRDPETHTYPAHHGLGPGLITLTSTTLLFTPLISLEPKFIIPLSNVQGVKKVGLVKGLVIHIVSDGESEREEKFKWVGSRDELFARLVGSSSRRWLKA